MGNKRGEPCDGPAFCLEAVFRSHCRDVRVFSVVSDSTTPWTVSSQAPLSMGFPGKNTGVGCHFFLQGISRPQDITCMSCVSCIADKILYPLNHQGSPLSLHPIFTFITVSITLGQYVSCFLAYSTLHKRT